MKTKTIIIILTIAGLIGSLLWLMTDHSWEPLVTSIGLVAALIAEIFGGGDSDKKNISMKQKGGKGSTNYQSGGDINITH